MMISPSTVLPPAAVLLAAVAPGPPERGGPCRESLAWLATLPSDTTALDAWQACPDGRWLLWIAHRAGVDRCAIVLAACACAELALPIFEARRPGDDRPRRAIEVTRAWCRGEATVEDVWEARAAADAADAAYAYAAAAYAADAAAYAAAAAAAAAAYAAAYADAAAAYAAGARADMLSRCADAVRREIPWPAVRQALNGRAL